MPATNPRLSVTLPPSIDALVTRMAELQRSSRASVIRELLEASEPAFRRAVALMEAATGAAQALRHSVASALEAEQAKAEEVLGHRMAAIDQLTLDLVAQAQAVKARRPARTRGSAASPVGADSPRRSRGRARSALPAPPPSNRGGK